MIGHVVSVARDAGHRFSKPLQDRIRLLEGLGVEGDAHCGETVKHRSRVRIDPTVPNLRQVHLIPQEVLDELAEAGFDVAPGALGENVLTRGLDLHALPTGARLRFAGGAEVELTGLRNPCYQIDAFKPGLLARVLRRTDRGLELRGGVMSVVRAGGDVAPGDAIEASLPDGPRKALERV
ncbi:MAG: MOSC domain-containing protein [Pseudomonadota bacterium]